MALVTEFRSEEKGYGPDILNQAILILLATFALILSAGSILGIAVITPIIAVHLFFLTDSCRKQIIREKRWSFLRISEDDISYDKICSNMSRILSNPFLSINKKDILGCTPSQYNKSITLFMNNDRVKMLDLSFLSIKDYHLVTDLLANEFLPPKQCKGGVHIP